MANLFSEQQSSLSVQNPQQFICGSTGARTLAGAFRVSGNRTGQTIFLEIEPNFTSAANSATASIALDTPLPSQFWPPRALTFPIRVRDDVGTLGDGNVSISTAGLVTFTSDAGFAAAAYVPLYAALSVQYAAF